MVVLRKGYIDLVLVPFGMSVMLGYHLQLLYRILRRPETTVIGFENHNKLAWVERMLERTPEETGLALQVISANITASTNMASLSVALSALIGALSGNISGTASAAPVFYGDTSPETARVKHVSVVVCFLAAFTCFVHSSRCFVHAAFLMSTLDSGVPVAYVQRSVIRGSDFWSLGLRALFFATVLLMWVFGPIPMFVSAVLTVAALGHLDANSTPMHQFGRHDPAATAKKDVARGGSPMIERSIHDREYYSAAATPAASPLSSRAPAAERSFGDAFCPA